MIENVLTNWPKYFLLAEKSFFVFCAVFYLIFAIIVVKQVTMLSKNIKDKFNSILITFSLIHLAFSVFLIFLCVTIL